MYSVEETVLHELDVEEWNDLLLKGEACDAVQTYEWARVLSRACKMRCVDFWVLDWNNSWCDK